MVTQARPGAHLGLSTAARAGMHGHPGGVGEHLPPADVCERKLFMGLDRGTRTWYWGRVLSFYLRKRKKEKIQPTDALEY